MGAVLLCIEVCQFSQFVHEGILVSVSSLHVGDARPYRVRRYPRRHRRGLVSPFDPFGGRRYRPRQGRGHRAHRRLLALLDVRRDITFTVIHLVDGEGVAGRTRTDKERGHRSPSDSTSPSASYSPSSLPGGDAVLRRNPYRRHRPVVVFRDVADVSARGAVALDPPFDSHWFRRGVTRLRFGDHRARVTVSLFYAGGMTT